MSEFMVHTMMPQRWPNRTFLTSPGWMALMGDRPPGRCHYFELAGNGGDTVAATIGYFIEDPGCYESFNIYELIWRDPPVFPERQSPPPDPPPHRDAWFPLLAIVQPGYDAAVVGADEPAAAQTGLLLDSIVRWACEAGAASVAILYAATPALVEALSHSGHWYRLGGSVRSRLDLPKGAFDDHLAGLSRGARRRTRADLREFERAGLRTEHLPATEVGETEVRLRMNLVNKYGAYSAIDIERMRLTRLTALFPPDRLQLFRSYDRQGEAVGFSLFIDYNDEWHLFWCGFDYERPDSRGAYFDSLFYAPIRPAQERGIRLIDYGLGHEASKTLRGCQAEVRDIWVAKLGGDLDRHIERAAAWQREVTTGGDG